MTLYDFFREYLPDFEKKIAGAKRIYENVDTAYWICYNTYLDDALKNFADRICKKQRENCGKFASSFDVIRDDIDIESAIIEHSLQPKIDEL